MQSSDNPSATGDGRPPSPGAPAKGTFRVLVIDNDDADRELTIRQLGSVWPFEHEMIPDSASSGADALAKMRSARYALVVLDWRLPGPGGGDVLRAMRQTKVPTPVIVLSGMQRTHIPEDIESLGAAFLNKDKLDSATLRDAIATSLRLLGVNPTPAAG